MEESSEQMEQLNSSTTLNPAPAKIFSSFGEFYGFFEALVEESQDDNKKLELQIFPKRPLENVTYVEVKTVHDSSDTVPSQQHTSCEIYKVLSKTKAKQQTTQIKENSTVNQSSDSSIYKNNDGQDSENSHALIIQTDSTEVPNNEAPSTGKTVESIQSEKTIVPVGNIQADSTLIVPVESSVTYVSTITNGKSVLDFSAADSEVSGNTDPFKSLVKADGLSISTNLKNAVESTPLTCSNSLDEHEQNKYSMENEDSPVITYHYVLDEDLVEQSKHLDSTCSDQESKSLTNAELEAKYDFQKLDIGLEQNIGSSDMAQDIDVQKTDTHCFNPNLAQDGLLDSQHTSPDQTIFKKHRGRPKKGMQNVHRKKPLGRPNGSLGRPKGSLGRPKGSVNKKINVGTAYLGTVDVPGTGRRSRRVQHKCQELIQKKMKEKNALRLCKESEENSDILDNRSEMVQTDYFMDDNSDKEAEHFSCSEPTTALSQIVITDARSIGEQQFSAGTTEVENVDSHSIFPESTDSNYNIPIREISVTEQIQPTPVKKQKLIINRRLLPNVKRKKMDKNMKQELKNVEAVEKEIAKQHDHQESISNEPPVVIENVFGDVIYVVGDEDVYATSQNNHTNDSEVGGVIKVNQQPELLNTFDASVKTFPTGIVKNAYAPISNDNIEENVHEAFSFLTASPQHLVSPVTHENPIQNFDAIENSMDIDFFHSLGLEPSGTVKPKRKYCKRKRSSKIVDLNEPMKKMKYSVIQKKYSKMKKTSVANKWKSNNLEKVKPKLGRPRKYNKQNERVMKNNIFRNKEHSNKLFKRGRGRPKKVLDTAVVKVKKKLGRPKKDHKKEELAAKGQDRHLLDNRQEFYKKPTKDTQTFVKIDKRKFNGKRKKIYKKTNIVTMKKHKQMLHSMTGKRKQGRPKKIVDYPNLTLSKKSIASEKVSQEILDSVQSNGESNKEQTLLTKSSEELRKTDQIVKKRGRPKKISSETKSILPVIVVEQSPEKQVNSPIITVDPSAKQEQVSLIERGKFLDFWESKRAKKQYHKFPFKTSGKQNVVTLMNLEIPLERIQTKDIEQKVRSMKKKGGKPKNVQKPNAQIDKSKSIQKTKTSLLYSEEQTDSQVNDSRKSSDKIGKEGNEIRESKPSIEINRTLHKDENERNITSSSEKQLNASQILTTSSGSDFEKHTDNVVERQKQVQTVQTQNASKMDNEQEVHTVKHSVTTDSNYASSQVIRNENAICETQNATEIHTNVNNMSIIKANNGIESSALPSEKHNITAGKKLQENGGKVIIDSEKGINFNVKPIKQKQEVEKKSLDISYSLVSNELIVKPVKGRRPLTINYKGHNISPKRINKPQFPGNLQTPITSLPVNKNAHTSKNIECVANNQVTTADMASSSKGRNEQKILNLEIKKDISFIQTCDKNEANIIVRNEGLPVQGRKQISLLQNLDILSKAKLLKEKGLAYKNANQDPQHQNNGKLPQQSVVKKGVNLAPKKKMGRPRKQVFDNVKNDTGSIDTITNTIDSVINGNYLSDNSLKKRRGRPPKSSCGSIVNQSGIKTDTFNLASSAKKKRMGRPKKKIGLIDKSSTEQLQIEKSESSLDCAKTAHILGHMKNDISSPDAESAVEEIKITSDNKVRDSETGHTCTNRSHDENCSSPKKKSNETPKKRWQAMDKKCFKLVRNKLLDGKAEISNETEMNNETSNSEFNSTNSSKTICKIQDERTDVSEHRFDMDSKLSNSKCEKLTVSNTINDKQETSTHETEQNSETHESNIDTNMHSSHCNNITDPGITSKEISSSNQNICQICTNNDLIKGEEKGDIEQINFTKGVNQIENEKDNLEKIKCTDYEMEQLEVALHDKSVKKRGRPPKMPVLTMENVENMFDKIKKGRDKKIKSQDSKLTTKILKRKTQFLKSGQRFKFNKQHPAVKKSFSEAVMKKKLGRPKKIENHENQKLESIGHENCTDVNKDTVINQHPLKSKKMGRPKKIYTRDGEENCDKNKKHKTLGRPKKISINDGMENSDKILKNKRLGRPKKRHLNDRVENSDEIQKPKNLGRPKKIHLNDGVENSDEIQKLKKLGSPKKIHSENGIKNCNEIPKPKKLGRPSTFVLNKQKSFIKMLGKKKDGRGRKKQNIEFVVGPCEENKQIIVDQCREDIVLGKTESDKPLAESVASIDISENGIKNCNEISKPKKLGRPSTDVLSNQTKFINMFNFRFPELKQTETETSTSDIDIVGKKKDGRGRKKKKIESVVEPCEEVKHIIVDQCREDIVLGITGGDKPLAESVASIEIKTQINTEDTKQVGVQQLESDNNGSRTNDIRTGLKFKKKGKLGPPKKSIEKRSVSVVKIRKKCGRPKKIFENPEGESITVAKKSKLGRPKKMFEKHNLKGNNPNPMKSKVRGRPKKIQDTHNCEKSSEFRQNVEKVVKRGRPKKILLNLINNDVKSVNSEEDSKIENIIINKKITDGCDHHENGENSSEVAEKHNSPDLFLDGGVQKIKSIRENCQKPDDKNESNVNTENNTNLRQSLQKAGSFPKYEVTVKPTVNSKKKRSPGKLKKASSYDDILNTIKVHVTKYKKPKRGRPKTKNVETEDREMPKLLPECPVMKTIIPSTSECKITKNGGTTYSKVEDPVSNGEKQGKLHSIGNVEGISGIKKTTGNVYVDSETFMKLKKMAGNKSAMSRMSPTKSSFKILKSTGPSYANAASRISSCSLENKMEKSKNNVESDNRQTSHVNVKMDSAVSDLVVENEGIGNSGEVNPIEISKEKSQSKESLNDQLTRLECNYEVVFDIESPTSDGQFTAN